MTDLCPISYFLKDIFTIFVTKTFHSKGFHKMWMTVIIFRKNHKMTMTTVRPSCVKSNFYNTHHNTSLQQPSYFKRSDCWGMRYYLFDPKKPRLPEQKRNLCYKSGQLPSFIKPHPFENISIPPLCNRLRRIKRLPHGRISL